MTKLVYRCLNCEAFVAFEDEAQRVLENSTSVHDVLTKIRTFNVDEEAEGGCLSCARCGREHYVIREVCELQSAATRLTLEEVFMKTPLRALLILRASSDYFYTKRTYRDPDGKKSKLGYVLFHDEYTYHEKTAGVKALNYLHDLCPRLCREDSDVEVEVDQRNVIVVGSWKPGQGENVRDAVNTSAWPCANKFEWYTRFDLERFKREIFNSTYDFVLHMKLFRGAYMTWTDSNAIGSEEYMVLSWLCSGGNMLFGQWGLPKDVGTLNGANINMEEVVEAFRGDTSDTNTQNTLADLAEWGHFLGWWGRFNRFPDYAEVKVKQALLQRQYKTWKFRVDFPQYTFTCTFRRNDEPSRVLNLRDAYSREDEEQTLYGIARKKSRVLFQEGLSFFQGLIQRTLHGRNQVTV